MPWLVKSEPEEREPGVKFSVDDFEAIGVTPWDGVRNPEACKSMRERMKIGDLVLFYHSNCKVPGVVALGEVVKEGYPDHTAWDPKSKYYDPKSSQESPKWYMVDIKFVRRLPHFVPLAFLQHIGASSALVSAATARKQSGASGSPEDAAGAEADTVAAGDGESVSAIPAFMTAEQQQGIAAMQLLNRQRLSVQFVEPLVYETIVRLGDDGHGWDSISSASKSKTKGKGRKAPNASEPSTAEPAPKRAKRSTNSTSTRSKSAVAVAASSSSAANEDEDEDGIAGTAPTRTPSRAAGTSTEPSSSSHRRTSTRQSARSAAAAKSSETPTGRRGGRSKAQSHAPKISDDAAAAVAAAKATKKKVNVNPKKRKAGEAQLLGPAAIESAGVSDSDSDLSSVPS